jgi:hypothetical protein
MRPDDPALSATLEGPRNTLVRYVPEAVGAS